MDFEDATDTRLGAGVILVNPKKQVLAGISHSGILSLPKGRIKQKDINGRLHTETAFQTARRETLEETGIDIYQFGHYDRAIFAHNVVYFVYYLRETIDLENFEPNSEFQELMWLDSYKANRFNLKLNQGLRYFI